MTLSIKESLSFGWRTFKARPWFFVEVSLLLLVVSLLSSFTQGLLTKTLGQIVGSGLSILLSITIDTFVGMGIVSLYLKAHDAVLTARLRDLWTPRPFVRYLVADAIRVAILIVGYLLLIIPGIFASVTFCFVNFLVIDRNLGPITALKESVAMTRGHRWKIFNLLLTIIGINLLGILALVVGLLVSVPVSILTMMHAYRTLSSAQLPVPAPEASSI